MNHAHWIEFVADSLALGAMCTLLVFIPRDYRMFVAAGAIGTAVGRIAGLLATSHIGPLHALAYTVGLTAAGALATALVIALAVVALLLLLLLLLLVLRLDAITVTIG